MNLVDTSVWVDHLGAADPDLVQALQQDQVLVHPWVMGELSLCGFRQRRPFLEKLSLQSQALVIEERLVLKMIQTQHLYDTGLSWVDCQLLASAKAMQVDLWTHDKALKKAWAKVFRS